MTIATWLQSMDKISRFVQFGTLNFCVWPPGMKVVRASLCGMNNDIYFQVDTLAIMELATRNAILITI